MFSFVGKNKFTLEAEIELGLVLDQGSKFWFRRTRLKFGSGLKG